MHPLRELPHESAGHTPEQVSLLLAENVVFHSPLLIRPLGGPYGLDSRDRSVGMQPGWRQVRAGV